MQHGIKIFFVVLITLGAFIGAMYIVSRYLKGKKTEEIKKTEISAKRKVHELLCLELFYKNVFSGFYFPVSYSRNGVALKYERTDTLAVTRGGVAIVSVMEQCGEIECSDEVWTSLDGGVYSEFDDPVLCGEKSRTALARLIRHGRLENVPVYSIVVFTSQNAILPKEYDNVVKLDGLIDMIQQLNAQRALSISEMFAVKKLFDTEKRTKTQVQKHMKKIYG